MNKYFSEDMKERNSILYIIYLMWARARIFAMDEKMNRSFFVSFFSQGEKLTELLVQANFSVPKAEKKIEEVVKFTHMSEFKKIFTERKTFTSNTNRFGKNFTNKIEFLRAIQYTMEQAKKLVIESDRWRHELFYLLDFLEVFPMMIVLGSEQHFDVEIYVKDLVQMYPVLQDLLVLL